MLGFYEYVCALKHMHFLCSKTLIGEQLYISSGLALARVGARAALRLALSLVRRAWRCGEEADVCSALLRDALDAVRGLPEAALYAGSGQLNSIAQQAPRSQKIWAEVVDSAAKFLHQVVAG